MKDKGKMDELIEQMKLMNERLERMERHQRRIDFTSEYQARQQGYTGFIDEDIAVAPKPPSRLFGNHFIKITDKRLGEEYSLKCSNQIERGMLPNNSIGKRWGIIDTGVGDIHDYGEYGQNQHKSAHYLQSLTEDDTDKEDFVWLNGDIKLGEVIGRRPWKKGEAKVWRCNGNSREVHVPQFLNKGGSVGVIDKSKANYEAQGWKFVDENNLNEVEITHRVPVLTETNDLGGEMRRAKAEAEEKTKQERLKREAKEKQKRLVREELEKKRKYEEDLRNRTERGEKFEFTPEQLREIVNNTPEGQRLLQEKKRRLEEEAGGAPREDSRVASLAEKVDEDLVVAEASSVGSEENT